MKKFNLVALTVFLLPSFLNAAPTWPSTIDEIEDILYLNNGFNARGFSFPIEPCDFAGLPGRVPAAGFVRTAFHDMATANVNGPGTGGLDASIAFELNGVYANANSGPGFNLTLTWYSQFFSSRASMSDLIAAGLYTAVRGFQGPIIPIRGGRIDASEAGPLGVPQKTDSKETLVQDFARLGFSVPEMIQVVACGHTLGGVHSPEFPAIVPPNTTTNDVKNFDTTSAQFDNKVAVEYVSNTSVNPLVVGPSSSASDARIFGADNGVTIGAMTEANAFQQTCAAILQKMIDIVPASVHLTDPITPYDVKPSAIQLSVVDTDTLSFTGQIRVRTNNLQVSSVQLIYKDRTGGTSEDSTIGTTNLGDANGYDDTFTFYGFTTEILSSSSISSFSVIVTTAGGSRQTFDNNGQGYPVQDEIMLQAPSSSLSPTVNADGTQLLSVIAAVRSTSTSDSCTLSLTFQNPRSDSPVPTLDDATVSMASVSTGAVGPYVFYQANYSIPPAQVNSTRFGVATTIDGKTYSDSFKQPDVLGSSAGPLPSGQGNSDGGPGTSSSTWSRTSKTMTTSQSGISGGPSGWPSSGHDGEGSSTSIADSLITTWADWPSTATVTNITSTISPTRQTGWAPPPGFGIGECQAH